MRLSFKKKLISAHIVSASGDPAERLIEVRTNPITGRTCRITFSRGEEREPGAVSFPPPPPDADDAASCPFCTPQVPARTPQLSPALSPEPRLKVGDSILFPNLYPYGRYSAVSLIGGSHFTEIGAASPASYTDSFINCGRYLRRVIRHDRKAVFMAITQNHLPSAGGSLVHPHLQVHADRTPSNHQRFLKKRTGAYAKKTGSPLFSDLLDLEKTERSRFIGKTGKWEWVAAFAPEGFFEIWGILPRATSVLQLEPSDWNALAGGVLHIQRFYRSLSRNGYNLGLLALEEEKSPMELRAVILARSNYAPWVRNDHTGFEVMLGDMATFVSPERTAELARPFFNNNAPALRSGIMTQGTGASIIDETGGGPAVLPFEC